MAHDETTRSTQTARIRKSFHGNVNNSDVDIAKLMTLCRKQSKAARHCHRKQVVKRRRKNNLGNNHLGLKEPAYSLLLQRDVLLSGFNFFFVCNGPYRNLMTL